MVEEIGTVRTRYGSTRFPMLGTYPGATMVARVNVPEVGGITFVSVYGLINVYAQTTMLRIVADLIPLFDSPEGERVVLGGDMNVTTATAPTSPEFRRYEAVLRAVESLGLQNLAETAAERPPQLENCLCGAATCAHLRTYGVNPGSQLDWLFATPNMARHCRAIRVDGDRAGHLSDHAPIVADLDIPIGLPTRHWDPDSFVQEVVARNGAAVGRVAEEIIAWALRKHHQLKHAEPHAALDRLPTSTGESPELWIQLDLRNPDALGYTISLTATGRVIVQFQHMRLRPFDSMADRRQLFDAIVSLPGIDLEDRLTGRPAFAMAALTAGDSLERFLRILDETVDRIVAGHQAARSRRPEQTEQ